MMLIRMRLSIQMLLIAWGTILSLKTVSGLPEVIKLAGLFDTNSASQEASFLRAITAVNDDRTILTKSLVSADVGRYPADDSFKASKKLCELIQPWRFRLFWANYGVILLSSPGSLGYPACALHADEVRVRS